MNLSNGSEFKKGDLLISRRKNYHYLVESIEGNDVTLFWLHRRTGEPSPLYTYRRKIKMDRALEFYDKTPSGQVDWSVYSNL